MAIKKDLAMIRPSSGEQCHFRVDMRLPDEDVSAGHVESEYLLPAAESIWKSLRAWSGGGYFRFIRLELPDDPYLMACFEFSISGLEYVRYIQGFQPSPWGSGYEFIRLDVMAEMA